MRRLLVVLVLLALSAIPAGAKPPEGGAVLLPVYLQGSYQPITGPEFTDQLLGVLKSAGMGKDVYRVTDAELQKAGFSTPSRPPSEAIAQGLCQSSGKRFCVWMSLQLSATMGPNKDNLAMSAATRFWAYDSQSGQVVLDSPVGSVHSLPVSPKAGPDQLAGSSQKLVQQNVKDLALQIVTMVQQGAANQRVQAWQAAAQARQPVAPAGPSQDYTAMVQACQDYAKAVAQSDLMATQDALKRAYTLYPALTGAEKQKIEQDYPGTEQWMNGGSWYGGGYYYPYPYPR